MIGLDDLRSYLLSKPGAREEFPFDPQTLVLKVASKIFALLALDEEPLRLNLKGDPLDNEVLREQFSAIIPGYHMPKRHWNTVIMDGTLDGELIKNLIDDSYSLVFESLSKKEQQQISESSS